MSELTDATLLRIEKHLIWIKNFCFVAAMGVILIYWHISGKLNF